MYVKHSSISASYSNYVEFCRLAVNDGLAFSSFRRHPCYTPILEHVSPPVGLAYLKRIKQFPMPSTALKVAAENDFVGGPKTITVENEIQISPTTLRYMNVACDIQFHFGDLENAKICEIGIGYGGQCRLLDVFHKIRSYTLVDIKPVLSLSERYLSHFPLRCKTQFLTMNELGTDSFDLVISNYAFSELDIEIQKIYMSKVLTKSLSGYLIYNQISPKEFRSMDREEIRRQVDGQILPEDVLTAPGNCLIIWKKLSDYCI
jgi:hypothetical protein